MKIQVRVGPSRIAGQGLFATQNITKGTRIIQYIGAKIPKDESVERLAQGNAYIFAFNDRYKDLASVEQAFRSCKTVHLEVRPIFLRLEARTRAHAFVVMLAYQIIRYLAACWNAFDVTVAEGLHALTRL